MKARRKKSLRPESFLGWLLVGGVIAGLLWALDFAATFRDPDYSWARGIAAAVIVALLFAVPASLLQRWRDDRRRRDMPPPPEG